MHTVLQTADVALPGGEATYISLPATPDGVSTVTKKFPDEMTPSGRSEIYLDQYSGKFCE